jgi:hypothetical protein
MGKERNEKERAEKEEANRSKKKEAIKDMVARWSDGGQGCSKNVQTWRK